MVFLWFSYGFRCEDAQMLEIYHQSIQTAADAAQRIYLRPGDALVVDNYRSLRSQGCCGGVHEMESLSW